MLYTLPPSFSCILCVYRHLLSYIISGIHIIRGQSSSYYSYTPVVEYNLPWLPQQWSVYTSSVYCKCKNHSTISKMYFRYVVFLYLIICLYTNALIYYSIIKFSFFSVDLLFTRGANYFSSRCEETATPHHRKCQSDRVFL